MKTLTYVIMFLILLQVAYAGEIFNGDVKDNVPVKINDDITVVARYYPSANKTSLLAGTERGLIYTGDCTAIAGLKYCIDSVEVGYNEESGGPASTIKLRVLEAGPTLEITRSTSTTTPTVNEEVEVTITILNSGNERAVNANYNEGFPDSVKVSSASYSFTNNGIVWTGSIDPGKSQTINYKLKFQDAITYETTGEASYIWNNKINKITNSKTFKVQKPYEVTDSLSSKSVDIADEVMYNVSINNTDPKLEITVTNLKIKIPSGAVIVSRDVALKDSDGGVVFTGKISGGKSQKLSITFKSAKTGTFDLTTDISVSAGGKTFTDKLTYKIGIGVSAIVPAITFTPETVKGGAELEVEAKITNNGDSTVSGISIDMASNIVDPRGWRDLSLATGKNHYAFNKIISAPLVEEEKKFHITLTGSYNTASGKKKPFELTKEVTVLPQERIIELTPDIIVDGKTVNVTLKIKNVAPYKLTYVSIIDMPQKEIKTTAGERTKDLEALAVGEETTVYSYLLKVPDTYTKDSFLITHTFNALDKDEKKVFYEKKTNVSLAKTSVPEAETEQANVTEQENKTPTPAANQTETPTQTEEKPGFFGRIWGWIKGLFS